VETVIEIASTCANLRDRNRSIIAGKRDFRRPNVNRCGPPSDFEDILAVSVAFSP